LPGREKARTVPDARMAIADKSLQGAFTVLEWPRPIIMAVEFQKIECAKGDVGSAALCSRVRPHLVKRLPEAERAIADG
jgi:hypothetical protein